MHYLRRVFKSNNFIRFHSKAHFYLNFIFELNFILKQCIVKLIIVIIKLRHYLILWKEHWSFNNKVIRLGKWPVKDFYSLLNFSLSSLIFEKSNFRNSTFLVEHKIAIFEKSIHLENEVELSFVQFFVEYLDLGCTAIADIMWAI